MVAIIGMLPCRYKDGFHVGVVMSKAASFERVQCITATQLPRVSLNRVKGEAFISHVPHAKSGQRARDASVER